MSRVRTHLAAEKVESDILDAVPESHHEECGDENPDGNCKCTLVPGHLGEHVGHVGYQPYREEAIVERWAP